MTTETFIIEMISPGELSSIDLRAELARLAADDDPQACILWIGDHAEAAEILYVGSADRAGIAWGADADWTDASSLEDAAERYLGIDGKEWQA